MQKLNKRVRWGRNFLLIAIVAFFYTLFGVFGLKLAVLPGNVTTVWIPAGIGLGAVLLGGHKVWPGIWLGSFGISVAIEPTPVSLTVGAFTAIGNTLTPILAVYGIRRFARTSYPLRRASEVFQFVFWGAIASQILSATMGVTALSVSQLLPWVNFGAAWLTWWVSNATGVLVVTPVLLTWSSVFRNIFTENWRFNFVKVKLKWQNFSWEKFSWFILFDVVIGLAFWRGFTIEYLVIPLLVWSIFRFSPPWTTFAIALVAAMAIAGTIAGKSVFVKDNLNSSLLFLESFIAVIAVTTLVLMAVLQERHFAIKGLNQAKAELESRVIERTQELFQANEQLQHQELHLREKADSLAQTLRRLKQTQAQLIQNEKMTSLGQLVAGIAHEINNPVSFIYSNLNPAKQYFQDLLDLVSLYEEKTPKAEPELLELRDSIDFNFIQEDCFKLIDSMQVGADRIQRIVLSLRNFARLDEAQLKWVNLHEGLDSVLLVLQHRFSGLQTGRSPIQILKHYGKLPKVECFAGEINQVFMQIIINALDAIDAIASTSGVIEIKTNCLESDRVAISITDNGGGIPPEIQNQIFDPFFTTKAVGKGTGLGLYTSYETIVKKHRGDLNCQVQNNQTTLTIILPIQHLSTSSFQKP
ncbi:MAG: MASE1 domain-containing protein [Jaaginema sp. PMC 1079.18]|nr:MASE1 domain-containing protein [Jaaginema sp. PMC 1080.18]MEC4849389.1 MASE1 domain-containing protein [Jaaginema sp. PMC 1079.18]MEC4865422.1 MASE1 domain-containing protein [Jaaginema sp. PMC 1078.18]